MRYVSFIALFMLAGTVASQPCPGGFQGSFGGQYNAGPWLFPPGSSGFFAATIVATTIGTPWTTFGSFQDPAAAVSGPPDYANPGSPGPLSGNETGAYCTGHGGSITVGFSTAFSNSGDSTPDLYVFESGLQAENAFIHLRPDPTTTILLTANGITLTSDGMWDIGNTSAYNPGFVARIDIDPLAPWSVRGELRFTEVRIIDDTNQCPNPSTGCGAPEINPGVEIDAVAAACWPSSGQATPPILNPNNGHYYQRSPTDLTFAAARAYASQLGGYLVAINSAAEENWLRANFGTTGFLIGLSDELTEGTFLWDSGEPVTYTNWIPGAPNNAACGGPMGEDYAYMNEVGATPSSFGWNDSGNTVPCLCLCPCIVEIVPVRPGTGHDLYLRTGIQASPTVFPDVKTGSLAGGQTITLQAISGQFQLRPLFLWANVLPVSPVPGFPGVQINPNVPGFYVILDGFGSAVLSPGGTTLQVVTSPGTAPTSVLLQALTIDPSIANGYAASIGQVTIFN